MVADAERVESQNAEVRARTVTVAEVVAAHAEQRAVIEKHLNQLPAKIAAGAPYKSPDEVHYAADELVQEALAAICEENDNGQEIEED